MVNKNTARKVKRHKQMSINELIKMNDNTISNIVSDNSKFNNQQEETGNYKILLQDAENDIDTYIIDNNGVGGIAVPYRDNVMIILGILNEKDKIITKEEFNKYYEIYEKY